MKTEFLTKKQILELFPKRDKDSHKGTFGKNVIFASSDEYVGAVKLAAIGSASMRMGVGYTCLSVTKTVASTISKEVFECTLALQEEKLGHFAFDEEKVEKALSKATCVAVGMGMKKTDETKKLIKYLLQKNIPLVIDADGINSINKDDLTDAKCPVILTPHIAEFSRISGFSIENIQRDRLNIATTFAKEHNVILHLKGSESITTDGERVFITTNSSPCLAKAGSGDFLSGCISALVARGVKPILAAAASSQIIADVATELSKKYNDNVILARDFQYGIRDYFAN